MVHVKQLEGQFKTWCYFFLTQNHKHDIQVSNISEGLPYETQYPTFTAALQATLLQRCIKRWQDTQMTAKADAILVRTATMLDLRKGDHTLVKQPVIQDHLSETGW